METTQRKMLKVTLYLWTDDLPENEAWASGNVVIPAQIVKGVRIPASKGKLFNHFDELPRALTVELERAGVKLHWQPQGKKVAA